MIRDPSDGSVREEINLEANKINAVAPKTRSEEISGLREASPKDTYQARLEWSRDWMKARNASKEREHAKRGSSSEQKLPSSGHPVEGQREAESTSPARSAVD